MNPKILIVVLCLVMVGILAACGGNEIDAQVVSKTTTTADNSEVLLSTQLLLGSFQLEGSELLPLWKAVRVLSESGTSQRCVSYFGYVFALKIQIIYKDALNNFLTT